MENLQSEKEKTVLYISYFFPPLGGGGVYRVLKFVRYLPEFGWRPIVLTVRDVWSRFHDSSLLEEIPAGTEVMRTRSLDPRRFLRLIQNFSGGRGMESSSDSEKPDSGGSISSGPRPPLIRAFLRLVNILRPWILIPDEFIGWLPFAFISGCRLIRRRNIPVIITTSYPHSIHLAGWLLKKAFGVKWIAEFRDAWAYHPNYTYPSFIHHAITRFLEKLVFRNADRVVFVYGLEENRKRYPQFKEKFIRITNGYDEDDFQNIEPLREEGFNILHVGALYKLQTPRYFFQALSELLSENPSLSKEFKVRFFGHIGEGRMEHIKSLSLERIVQVRPFIPHLECLQYMVGADVLLLFLGGDDDNIVIPGKVFEYLRSPARTLAMVPEGETAEIIRQGNSGVIIPTKDVAGIKKAILEMYDDFKHKRQMEKNLDFVKTKERKELTRSLVGILNELAGST